MIVLNSLNDTGAGFGHATNKVTIISKNNTMVDLPLMSKSEVARKILNLVAERLS